jgi:hypothetical protein
MKNQNIEQSLLEHLALIEADEHAEDALRFPQEQIARHIFSSTMTVETKLKFKMLVESSPTFVRRIEEIQKYISANGIASIEEYTKHSDKRFYDHFGKVVKLTIGEEPKIPTKDAFFFPSVEQGSIDEIEKLLSLSVIRIKVEPRTSSISFKEFKKSDGLSIKK